MAKTRITTDHDEIRRWAEERGGVPATVKATEQDGEPGILRIDFPGFSGEGTLEQISWEDFFRKFDENNLAFVYDADPNSRFNKLVSRETAQQKESRGRSRSAEARSRSTASRSSRRSSTRSGGKSRAKSSRSAGTRSTSAGSKRSSRSRSKAT